VKSFLVVDKEARVQQPDVKFEQKGALVYAIGFASAFNDEKFLIPGQDPVRTTLAGAAGALSAAFAVTLAVILGLETLAPTDALPVTFGLTTGLAAALTAIFGVDALTAACDITVETRIRA